MCFLCGSSCHAVLVRHRLRSGAERVTVSMRRRGFRGRRVRGLPLALEANPSAGRVLYDPVEISQHEAQLAAQVLRRRTLPQLDRLDDRLLELPAHRVHRLHLEVRVANRDQICNRVGVQLALHLEKGLDLPHFHTIGEVPLELRPRRDDADLLQHRNHFGHVHVRAALYPTVKGVGHDKDVAPGQRLGQQLLRQARDGTKLAANISPWVVVQEARTKQRVVPIENCNRLVLRGPLLPGSPCSRV
mmetsp:Transcript_120981/g.349584  ORF Transcript_120981/g.349584 Transcript_120981/m.349584 type:complete len:245 (+) Transcript_120981:105-839(+)